jgi:carboxyl-terminal processing protease
MPRRNLHLLWVMTIVCLACYAKVDRQTRVLGWAMNEILASYVEPVTQRELFEGAMTGMMSRLDDYSVYISPQVLKEFQQELHQEFGGVGVQILLDPDTKQLTVANPLVGSPAYKAGIHAGDKILRINGESTHGLSLEDASSRMRGKPGKGVILTVLHAGETEPVDVEITRAIVQQDAVLGDSHNGNGTWNYFLEGEDKIAYLRLDSFGDKTVPELRRVLRQLAARGMKGLILDLRNNPGGSLDSAIFVCDMFLPSPETIVTTRGRNGQVRDRYVASGHAAYPDVPMVVLINRFSASASEIVAACLQDHDRAVIVGERSFGKGTVQELLDLAAGQGAMKLTTASYWRPSGRNIQRTKNASETDAWGVSPNPGYEIKLDPEQITRLVRWRLHRDLYQPAGIKMPGDVDVGGLAADPHLARAVEYLKDLPPQPKGKQPKGEKTK